MDRILIKLWGLRITGFTIGVFLALALEILILATISVIFDTQLAPRGIGWVIVPISAGVAGATILSQNHEKIITLTGHFLKKIFSCIKNFNQFGVLIKIPILGSLFWFATVALFVFFFEPYGWMNKDDFMHMLKVMIFPSIILTSGSLIYAKYFRKV